MKKVKRSIKRDKRTYLETLANDAEEAAHRGDLRSLYATIRKITGKSNRPDRPIKNKAGQSITDQSGQMSRWTEYFEELLNRPEPEDPPDIAPALHDLDISCGPPTSAGIQMAISQLKNGKAAGPDNIPPEALKNDIVTSAEALQPLFQKIWSSERVPESWREGHLLKLQKREISVTAQITEV